MWKRVSTGVYLTTRPGSADNFHDNSQLDWLILYAEQLKLQQSLASTMFAVAAAQYTNHCRLTMLTAQKQKCLSRSPETEETLHCCAETLPGGDARRRSAHCLRGVRQGFSRSR